MMYVQLLFNTLVSGLLLAVVAIGFNLIFNTLKVFHLAHGAIYVSGAYSYLYFIDIIPSSWLGRWVLALFGSFVVVGLIAILIEVLVYRPLSNKKVSQAITLISSIGLYLFLINLIALIFGNKPNLIDPGLGSPIQVGFLSIAQMQLIQLLLSVLIIGSLILGTTSNWFLKVRAVISNEVVASAIGVNSRMIRLQVIVLGSLLTSIVSILYLHETGVDPQRGMSITLSAAVAVIIGGQGSLKGTVQASILIALLQTSTEWFVSSQWKDGLTFLLLIVVLLWKTEGIVSFRMRVEGK